MLSNGLAVSQIENLDVHMGGHCNLGKFSLKFTCLGFLVILCYSGKVSHHRSKMGGRDDKQSRLFAVLSKPSTILRSVSTECMCSDIGYGKALGSSI